MPKVVRAVDDKHVGHASPTPNPFHQTAYVAGQQKVFAMGKEVIRGANIDSTSCGDPAVGCSEKVFVKGTGVHRKGDSTGGHGSWVANSAESGADKVFADGD